MEQISNQERLELITSMISQAKSSIARGGSNQILLWGWVIAFANLANYVLVKLEYGQAYYVWLVIIPAIVVSVILSRKGRNNNIKSHLDSIYGQIWIAVGIAIVFTLTFMTQIAFFHNPIILMLAGVGMYITGNLLRYRPIIAGAVVLWIAALIEWQLPTDQHLLVSGIAIILGYLIPGYMLKNSENE